MESTSQSSVLTDAVKNYAPTEREPEEFTAISDNDDDYNLLLWQAFAGPPPTLPEKGDLVVYFPQGHLEYAASASVSSLPPTEAPTFDLKPEIICRVLDVQLLVSKKNDKVYTKMALLPLPEMVGENLKGKELQELVVDEKGDRPANSTPHLFYKKLTTSDKPGRISIPTKDAENVLPPLDYKRLYYHYVFAKDVHGVEWKFWHVAKGKSRPHYLTKRWSQFVSQKNLVPGDTVVFIRDENMKLRLGIKRVIQATNGILDPIIRKHNTFPSVLSPVADAISNNNTFDVFYSPRASQPEFVICYRKYMKSIRKPVCIGETFQMQSELDDSSETRCRGVVTGTRDLDPNRWPNSKWRCLLVRWDEEIGNREEQVSPWEIDCSLSLPSSIHSPPRLKRPRTSLQENSPATSTTDDVNRPSDLELPAPAHHPLDLTLQDPLPKNPLPLTLFRDECTLGNSPATSATALDCAESSTAVNGEVFDCAVIAGNLNRPFDLELQAPLPKNPLPFTLFPDEDMILRITPGETLDCLETNSLASLASFLKSELATSTVKQLKINKCPDIEVLIHRMAQTSLEYLEFNGCSFFSYSRRDYFPATLKRLKICDCPNSELILKVLMDQKGLSLESLEIDGCSSLYDFPINKLPATLRHLKIVNCMNLKALSDSFVVGPDGDSSLENMALTSTLELRELEIWDCVELEFLPEGLHNFNYLNLLSISNCPSLESFPEGGLPNTSLTSLLISECENLKSLPHQIHKVTSLQNLSVSGCPSLMSFPQRGLPRNLISLGIIDCENLIPLSHWELHKLRHLRKYSVVGGRPDLGQ